MKFTVHMILVPAFVGALTWGATRALGACRRTPPAVAHQLAELAGEVCLESDNVEICARKCADAAAPKE